MKKPEVITTEKLNEYFNMHIEKEKISNELSNNAKKIRAKNDNNEVDYKNDKGVVVKVKEKILWQEMQYLGLNEQGGKILREKHPKLFELIDKEQLAVKELKKYEVDTFGFDYTQMSMPNIITLIRSLIRYENKNYEK